MTEQPTRDQLRAGLREMIACFDEHGVPVGISPRDMESLLDQLDQAEAELDYWMTRAYEAEKRAWQAEARIRAVRDVLDSYGSILRYLSDPVINTCSEIRSALEGKN